MSSVDEVEKAIRELSVGELTEFRRWFYEFDAKLWDAEFEADAVNGNLDELGDGALSELRSGRTRPL